MKNLNNFELIPCILLSLIFHAVIFVCVFDRKPKEDIIVQVPFEVSFYSPVISSVTEKVETKEEPKQELKQVKSEPKKKKNKAVNKTAIKKKSDLLINNKQTREVVVKEQEQTEQQVVEEQNTNMYSSSKGIMLENKNFKYSYYTNTIVKKIGRYWQWSGSMSSLRAILYFKIGKDGLVYDVAVKETSYDPDFDKSAIRAIELASPFAPLPTSYEEDYLGVYFEFKFEY